MTRAPDLRAALDDPAGLLQEILRRDKIIDALAYQVERNLGDQDQNYGLLQTTFMLEEQVRQRTAELTATLDTLSEVTAQATAARDQLEAAVEAISDGFALFDPEGRVLLCNPAFRRLWGLAGSVKGQTLAELLEAAEAHGGPGTSPRASYFARLTACRAGCDRCELELPGGQSLRIRERRLADGCLVGVYSDVTDLKAEEARLRQQELARKSWLLQSTLDTIDQGIAVFDATPALVAWNLHFFTLLGLPHALAREGTVPQQLAGADDPFVYRLCTPGDADRVSPAHLEHAVAGGPTLDVSRFPMPDGGFVVTASDISARKEGEERIRELLVQQRAIFDNAHVGILFVRDRRILDANSRMAEMFRYPGPEALIGQLTEVLFPSHADFLDVGARLYAELGSRGYSEGDVCMACRDGHPLWVRISGRPLDPQAPQDGSIWVYSDLTGAREQQAQLELAQLVFNHSNEALMVTDADNLIRSVNTAFTTITGYEQAEVLGQSPRIFRSGEHDEAFYREMWTALLRDDRWEGEIIDRHKSGRFYPKWLTIRVVRHADGRIAHFVAAFRDISARKAAEAKIQYMAHHDALTGLPNRVLLRDRFEQTYRRIGREGHTLAMCFLDLDHFKRINDTLGHGVGDELLVAVTQRLRHCLRASDTVSRLGGDEFIILVEGTESPRFFAAVAEKICQALDAPVELGAQSLSVSGTLGIAVAPVDGEDFDTLLKKADMAMYHAKARGRGSYSFFDERMNRDTAQRLVLTGELRHALERQELRLVYQPQFDLADRRIVGVEALMRWRSERFGEVSPAQFIPLAEETGLIPSIGEWALFESCRQVRAWQEAGLALKMAVNISALQVYRDDFAATLTAVLRDTGASAASVELELTESTLMADTSRFIDVIAYLRALGISVAIDDFGTGYSSLAYLKRFQVSKLKVDRSFIQDIPADEDARAIAEAIVRMGQSLRLRVIAEGVETHAQLDFLRTIGCHEAQGYLLSRPVPPADVERLVAAPLPPHTTPDPGHGATARARPHRAGTPRRGSAR
jgi:diguanylate cyclase (GGDEF)-like protein/PAS domain S-box-containing protein